MYKVVELNMNITFFNFNLKKKIEPMPKLQFLSNYNIQNHCAIKEDLMYDVLQEGLFDYDRT